jgi:hypothetical protein
MEPAVVGVRFARGGRVGGRRNGLIAGRRRSIRPAVARELPGIGRETLRLCARQAARHRSKRWGRAGWHWLGSGVLARRRSGDSLAAGQKSPRGLHDRREAKPWQEAEIGRLGVMRGRRLSAGAELRGRAARRFLRPATRRRRSRQPSAR